MHFERSAVQTFFEHKLGCQNPERFVEHIDALISLKLSLNDSNVLADKIQEDIQGQFERSVLTLLQALVDISNGNFLWSAVKLYYSIFYALRVELHLKGLSIIRCNKVFTTSGATGLAVSRFNNKTAKGDHGIAIALATKHLSAVDILQGASIESINVYLWMKNLREIVQYKMRRPPELTGFNPFFL